MARKCLCSGTTTGPCVTILELAGGDSYTPPSGYFLAPGVTGDAGEIDWVWNGTDWVYGPPIDDPPSPTSITFNSLEMVAKVADLEAWRVDSAGRMLVGAAASLASGTLSPVLQVSDDSTNAAASVHKFAADASPAILLLAKSRGAAVGDIAAIAASDVLGRVDFAGSGTSLFGNRAARIDAIAAAAFTNTSAPAHLALFTTPASSVTPLERLRIRSTGEVQVGNSSTATANALLHVNNTGSGNSFQVDDSTDPDVTPFVIDAVGKAIFGGPTALDLGGGLSSQLQVLGVGPSSALGIGVFAASVVWAPTLGFNKSRGTISAPHNMAVTAGDYIGNVLWSQSDGTAFIDTARIRAIATAADAASMTLATKPSGGTLTEWIRLTDAGLVGIGTTTPAVLLHLLSATTNTNAVETMLRLSHNVTGTAAIGHGVGLAFAGETGSGNDTLMGTADMRATAVTAAAESIDFVVSMLAAGVMTESARIKPTGALNLAGTQVLTTRRTGWTAATGTATRTTFVTSTVTLAQLAERVKALIDDLTTHGMIGT